MTGMWRRLARRRRVVGLTYLTLAAVAMAIAVLMFTIGAGLVSGFLGVITAALVVTAGVEFARAARYERLTN